MAYRRSRSHRRRGSASENEKRLKKLQKEVDKLRAEILPLKKTIQEKDKKIETLEEGQYKDDKKQEMILLRLASQENEMKKEQELLLKQRANLERDQNKLRQEKKRFDASRNAHHDDAHDTGKKQRWLEVEEERLKKMEHRLRLEQQRLDHGKVQVEQQKLALEHNAEVQAVNKKTISMLVKKLSVAEGKLKRDDNISDLSYNKLMEKINEYPEWVKKNGWDYQLGRKQMDDILQEFEQYKELNQDKGSLKDNDSSYYLDLTLKYQKQLNMNSLLHEELERVHADYQHLQKGLAENMAELEKNEDLLVHHVHEMLSNYEESSVQQLSLKNPKSRIRNLVNTSNNKIRALMATVDERVSKGYSETKFEGVDSSLLNQVHMKGEIKLLLEELLLKIGRLLIGMNHQISQNIESPGAGGNKPVALSKRTDTETKLLALRKKHEELQQHCSLQEDAMMLLKQQCHEQSMRHAQIHNELETVLKFFLRARGQGNFRSGESKSELTVEKLYKAAPLMPAMDSKVADIDRVQQEV